MDEKQRINNPNPYNKAGFFSKLFLCWISPLLKLGHERPLREDDLYNNAPGEESDKLIDNLENEWNKELKTKGKNASLLRAITRIYFVKYFFLSMLIFLEESLNIAQPFIISSILQYFEGTIDLYYALVYGSLLSLIITIKSIIHHPYFLNTIKFGQRVRIACYGLIYKKITKLSAFELETRSGGQIINLIANDATKLESVVLFAPFLILGPLEALVVLVFLFYKVDVSFLAGLTLLLLFIPLQSINGKLTIKFKKLVAKKCDKRLSLLSEVLNGIKIIKMYCWEKPFKITIENLRNNELKTQKNLFFISSINSAIDLILPTVFVFVSVSFFIFFSENFLKPSYIVLAMSFYNRLNVSLGNHFVKAITVLLGAKVSLKRIQTFLLKDELEKTNSYKQSNNPYVLLENVNASWQPDSKTPVLKSLNIEIRNRELTAIVGAIGSGKTSLLMTILGEIESIKGDLKVSGSVFYVPQEPWIFNGSIKQNITFGKPYDKNKFDEIIKVCCLTQDLKSFPRGAKTMLGEKGINLSGGQKSRVSLARALYSDAQIYLLDDPLSAVDLNVARTLYEKCINGYLHKKIRILVTHHLHYLKQADQIVILENGEIKSKGTYNEIVSCQKNMNLISNIEIQEVTLRRSSSIIRSRASSLVRSNSDIDNSEFEKMMASNQMLNMSSNHLSNLGTSKDDNYDKEYQELQKYGSMPVKTYLTYFKIGSGIFGAILNFIVFILSQLIIVYTDYWINNWASVEHNIIFNSNYSSSNNTSLSNSNYIHVNNQDYSRFYYYKVYAGLTIFGVLIGIFRAVYFYGLCIKTSKNLHKNMFESLMSTHMRFYDLNPLGRIMNRFSRDISLVDETIPITLFDFMSFLIIVLSGVFIAVAFNYWIIMPLIILIIILIFQRRYFLASSMEVKRIEGITRSPIFIHCNSTIDGITIIRTSKNEEKFFEEFKTHVDYNTRASITFTCINRWFAVRLDWIANVFVYIVVFGCILLKDYIKVNSGQIGMMLVYLCRIIAIFQWCIRQSCEVENLMTSVERILEYVSQDKEPLEKGKLKPDKDWPQKANIRFENVSFSYAQNSPDVLDELNFEIKSGEKIGIVGRTGAGKSSIISTLFRLAEPKGNIYIDDINIQDISLHDLRNKLSIIPQEPTLFIGTIRSNLDPFNEHSDDELWSTLEKVQLKVAVQEMKGGLEAEIQKGGANLSVGQKQLICLARAIIKKSKILIIDEATANVDYVTDSLVQKAIRECFSDCTVLTIAHRLETIIDNDKILCLNKGKLENYGIPIDLLEDKTTILYNLVHSLSKKESQKLIDLAKKASKKLTD